ncbi:MAG: SsrA-binding protein SmpB [Candidatus Omnitrophica bacterium]|nr:SsrA-binding protein SmpB [Candidatus Omnitrophota bacterium]MDD5027522.1 SsrA-binding protein SmpB [Candidatus Omnitrophota bacterium]MDD5662496.1 SsrA-binding protein SmpB [Candidatus Omnitrophota bacterium]
MSKIIASNHKGYRDYAVIESFECGVELKGSEVKSVRQGKVNLNDSFARVEEGELILYNTHINPYAEASYMNVEPTRKRRLLLHKNQIEKLKGKLTQKGLTLIPLKIYFNPRGFVKIEIALGKGKKLYDKRDDIKRRETDIALRRAMRNRR